MVDLQLYGWMNVEPDEFNESTPEERMRRAGFDSEAIETVRTCLDLLTEVEGRLRVLEAAHA